MENNEQTPESPENAAEETAPTYNANDNRNFAIFAHLGGLAFFIPFGNLIVPLVIWLIKKDELPLVDHAGKESLNFQISMSIYGFVSFLLWPILIGIPISFVLFVIDVIMIIKAAMHASEGKEFTYPLSIRFIK